MSEQVGEVTGVHLFPIKLCQEATIGGVLPAALEVGPTGFEWNGVRDRGIVIADADGLFVSQRGWDAAERKRYPGDTRLATVAIDIQPDHLAVTALGFGTLEIATAIAEAESREVNIFGAPLFGFDIGDDAAEFFSRVLDDPSRPARPVRLFMADPIHPRFIKDTVYHRPDATNQAAAADGFPFLLANQDSLDDAHDQAGLPRDTLPIMAYRANIDVRGLGAWAEDRIRRVRIGNFVAYLVKPCSRCPIPNVDQRIGGKPHNLSNQLLRIPRTGWRSDQDPETAKERQYFGGNLNHLVDSIGAVIGKEDPVIVEEWGESNVQLKRAA